MLRIALGFKKNTLTFQARTHTLAIICRVAAIRALMDRIGRCIALYRHLTSKCAGNGSWKNMRLSAQNV